MIPPFLLRAALRFAAALLIAAAPAAMAQAPTAQPIAPDAAPVRHAPPTLGAPDPLASDSSIALFASHRAAAGMVTLVVGMPGARGSVADRARLSQALAACGGGDRAPARLPWADYDSAASDPDLVVLHATAWLDAPPSCAAAADPAVIATGVEVAPDVPKPFPPVLLAATVERDGRPIAPTFLGRRVTEFVGSAATDSFVRHSRWIRPQEIRLYVPLGRLLADDRGRISDVRLSLQTQNGDWSPSVVVPGAWLDSLWRRALPTRVAAAGARPTATSPLPALATPRDAVLRAAYARYRADSVIAAGVTVARRVAPGASPLSDDDERFAHLLVGSALLAHGDTVGGRIEYAAALRETPCLALAPSGGPVYAATLAAARGDTRCTPIALTKLLAWGTLFPGGALARRGDRMAARVVGGVALVAFGTAWLEYADGQRIDRAYRGSTYVPQIVEHRLDANAARAAAGRALAAGVVTWAGGAVWGVVREWRWSHDVAEQQRYGARADGGAR